MPPTTGGHSQHLSAVSGSNTDYTECVACHGDYTLTHVDGDVDVVNASVTYDTTLHTCTTTSCHSPAGNPADWDDAGQPWDSTGAGASFDCDECHYWDTSGSVSAVANSNAPAPLTNDHGNHFTAGYYCTDCHASVWTRRTSHPVRAATVSS
jgi:predicted CxxxxCH...CXXCH cytochrome family protein